MAAGVVAVVLLAGLSVSLWQMFRAIDAEGQANQNAQQARDERDAKDMALNDEAKARQQAFAALRSMTADVVERKFTQGTVLTEDDRAFLRGVIAQFDAFAAIKVDDADSRAVRAEGRLRVGQMRYTLGEIKEAEQDYDQALSLYKQVAADFPFRAESRRELARSHQAQGMLLYQTGRATKAKQEFDHSLSLYKQLGTDFPTRTEFRQELATSHMNRGVVLFEMGRLKEAEEDWSQTLSIQNQLATDFANQPDLRNQLAGTCVNLASLHLQQRSWAAAKRLLLEGQPHHLAALKANSRHPEYRQFYRNHLIVLTAVHAGLLEQEDAVRTAETCRHLGWDAPEDAYSAACGLSNCLSAVAKHPKLDDKQRKEAARFYGDAAMKQLRDAVSKGYKDVALLKRDPDLDPLRGRDDFKQLIAEVEGKGK